MSDSHLDFDLFCHTQAESEKYSENPFQMDSFSKN